jgi:hypothetical protein
MSKTQHYPIFANLKLFRMSKIIIPCLLSYIHELCMYSTYSYMNSVCIQRIPIWTLCVFNVFLRCGVGCTKGTHAPHSRMCRCTCKYRILHDFAIPWNDDTTSCVHIFPCWSYAPVGTYAYLPRHIYSRTARIYLYIFSTGVYISFYMLLSFCMRAV